MSAQSDRALGAAQAVLSEATETIKKIATMVTELNRSAQRYEQISREVEILRDIVPGLEKTLRDTTGTEWMTTAQCARYLRVHQETVRQWYRRGVIPGYRFTDNGDIRFDRSEVDRAVRKVQPETFAVEPVDGGFQFQ